MYTIVSANSLVMSLFNNKNLLDYFVKNGFNEAVIKEEPVNIPKRIKLSAYNYCVNKNDGIAIYNTMYGSLVRLDSDDCKVLDNISMANEELINDLYSNGIVVDAELSELDRYLYIVNYLRSKNIGASKLYLTVATTSCCNARCFYCFENGCLQRNIYSGAENDIIAFIKKYNNGRKTAINLFGGEPLLNIEFINKLISQLNVEKIPFSTRLVTNGSLLTEKIILEELPKWNLEHVQITLDGTCDEYLRRKNYYIKNEDVFYKIISTIKKLAKLNIQVAIRLNIDSNNCEDILELVKDLMQIFGKYTHVCIYPAFLTGIKEAVAEQERVPYLCKLLAIIKDMHKMMLSNQLYEPLKIYKCMIDKPYAFFIDQDGNVNSCEHVIGEGKGNIGNVKDIDALRTKCIDLYLESECQKCIFLPRCLGGCDDARDKHELPCPTLKYLIKAYLRYLQ